MAKPPSAEHKCLKCGRCCTVKVVIDGEVYYTSEYCPYFDPHTRLCTIYERRHQLNPDCLTIEEGIRLQALPTDCPYVKDIPNYSAPHLDLSDQEINGLIERKRRSKQARGR